MKHRTISFLALLSIVGSSLVQAQPAGPSTMPSMDPAMCDQLAQLPNSPMTADACRKMMKMGQDNPSANRPGDEAMSCDQILADMKTTPKKGVSKAEAARTEAMIRESQTLDARMGAQTQAAIAPETAALTAAAAVGGFVPNAVTAAVTAAPLASMQAKTAAAGQANLQERRRLSDQTASNIDARLASNPRSVRLAKLAVAKGCDLKGLSPP